MIIVRVSLGQGRSGNKSLPPLHHYKKATHKTSTSLSHPTSSKLRLHLHSPASRQSSSPGRSWPGSGLLDVSLRVMGGQAACLSFPGVLLFFGRRAGWFPGRQVWSYADRTVSGFSDSPPNKLHH
ncbi:hypothetical protein AVEN_32504-1 [Araneus ventricosus]|uniref:Uncharacterized protein n=1 Tax=Araneus ventricosus TaxID=182803 RepID=A0A4Y2VT22_ARAVE|nr:hypothetical protein AVEN_32504-1 [Araneus ventricosus]